MTNAIYEGLWSQLQQADDDRMERMKAAWEAYFGQLPKPLVVAKGKPDDNARLNFSRMIVDKGVSFLFGKEVEFEIDTQEETSEEEWLEGFWQQNKKMTLLQKLGLNGGVCGQAFIKLKIQKDLVYPRLVLLDPETVSVVYEPDDIEKVIEYRIQYVSTDNRGQPVGVRQVITQAGVAWTITDEIGDLKSLTWRVVNTEAWPHEFAPVVYCQNLPAPNEFWGLSDLETDLIDLNKSINFVMSNMVRIIRYHAHPKTVGKGFTADQLKVDADGMIVLPSPLAELFNLEMQSDLGSSLEIYKRLKESLHEIARVPEVSTGKTEGLGALSGLALQILYQSLVEKTETKRLLYGDLLVELNRRALSIAGFGEDNITELHWQEMLPEDAKAEREVALLDKQLGVSTDTILMKLGYDPDLEKEKKGDEQQALGDGLLSAFEKGQETTGMDMGTRNEENNNGRE